MPGFRRSGVPEDSLSFHFSPQPSAHRLTFSAVPPAAISFDRVSKNYGPTTGLHELSLEVGDGECMGFLGPNGAGKTTAIRVLIGLIKATSGRTAIRGHDVATSRLSALREVGYLPGELGLIREVPGGRLLDALAALHPRPPVFRDELLRRFDLDASALRRPTRQYSRGMKQKLGLVAALEHDPPVVILDEPTGGLDPVMSARLIEWLSGRAKAGRTVFFSSHVLAEVEELCDRVAMVRDSRLLVVESVDELRRARVRNVTVQFGQPVEPKRYATAGVGQVDVSGVTHRFTFSGEARDLVAGLAGLPVVDLSIETARLEDVFRARYGVSQEAAA